MAPKNDNHKTETGQSTSTGDQPGKDGRVESGSSGGGEMIGNGSALEAVEDGVISVDRPMDETVIEVVPVGESDYGIDVEHFLASARVVADAARSGALGVPTFRSPPRTPGLDRSITRYRNHTVIAVRRKFRPAEAVKADLIEGVIVMNELDPLEASAFRRNAWSALNTVIRHGATIERGNVVSDLSHAHDQSSDQSSNTDPSDVAEEHVGRTGDERMSELAAIVELAEHASAA